MTNKAVDLDRYIEVIRAGVPEEVEEQIHEDNPLVSFAGKMSHVRAYIYSAIAAPQNNTEMTDPYFIAGLSRFGIENPVPVVSARCWLYGNSRDIITQLEKAEKRWGRPPVLDSKQFTSKTMGIPPKKRPIRKATLELKYGEVRAPEKGFDEADLEMERLPEVEVDETPYDQVVEKNMVEPPEKIEN